MTTAFPIKRNDTSPSIAMRLRNGDGTIPDLTGASVVFNMRSATTKASVVDRGAMVVHDLADGVVRYDWIAADTAAAGLYQAEAEVTFADGGITTYPNHDWQPVKIDEDAG